MTIDPRAIEVGKLFAQYVEEALTPEQFADMLRRNATPEYGPGVCASHDFIDANECMEDAFVTALGTPEHSHAGLHQPGWDALWSTAWEWAKAHYLTDNATRHALESDGWPEIPANDPGRVCMCAMCRPAGYATPAPGRYVCSGRGPATQVECSFRTDSLAEANRHFERSGHDVDSTTGEY